MMAKKEEKLKKNEVIAKEEFHEGAKLAANPEHTHALMGIKMNLLEINHRVIEEIEQYKYRLMRKHEGEESIKLFKEFVWQKLTEEPKIRR